jgi:hypothetical protein
MIYYFIIPNSPQTPNLNHAILCIAVSIVFLIASFILPKIIFSQTSRQHSATLQSLITPTITLFALNEVVMVSGFIFAFETKTPTYYLPFLILGVLHLLYRYPSSEEKLLRFYS